MYVPTPPDFAYFSGFSLQTTRLDLLYSVAISEFCVATLTAILLSAILDAPSDALKGFARVSYLISEDVLLTIPSHVQEFTDYVGFCRAIHKCSFDAPVAYLVYRRLGEVKWSCIRCLWWGP